jgi:hypothetical protein
MCGEVEGWVAELRDGWQSIKMVGQIQRDGWLIRGMGGKIGRG